MKNLTRRTELNGKKVRIVGYDASNERWRAIITEEDGSETPFRVRPENMEEDEEEKTEEKEAEAPAAEEASIDVDDYEQDQRIRMMEAPRQPTTAERERSIT